MRFHYNCKDTFEWNTEVFGPHSGFKSFVNTHIKYKREKVSFSLLKLKLHLGSGIVSTSTLTG